MKNLKTISRLILAVFITVFVLGCKSPQKVVSDSKQKEETSINNDTSSDEEKRTMELTDRIVKQIVNEQLNIGIKSIKYDTEKPVDSVTGKHPVSEETLIKVRKKTETNETDSIRQEEYSVSSVQIRDNSQIKTKSETVKREEKETELERWKKALIAIGTFCLVGFIIFIIIKIRK